MINGKKITVENHKNGIKSCLKLEKRQVNSQIVKNNQQLVNNNYNTLDRKHIESTCAKPNQKKKKALIIEPPSLELDSKRNVKGDKDDPSKPLSKNLVQKAQESRSKSCAVKLKAYKEFYMNLQQVHRHLEIKHSTDNIRLNYGVHQG